MSYSRSEGLVKRHKNRAETTIEESHDDEARVADDVEDHDSKETRLTLMEEVLLLGLKDREVRPKRYATQSINILYILVFS